MACFLCRSVPLLCMFTHVSFVCLLRSTLTDSSGWIHMTNGSLTCFIHVSRKHGCVALGIGNTQNYDHPARLQSYICLKKNHSKTTAWIYYQILNGQECEISSRFILGPPSQRIDRMKTETCVVAGVQAYSQLDSHLIYLFVLDLFINVTLLLFPPLCFINAAIIFL